MKRLLMILPVMLTACASDLAGLSPTQRDELYATAAVLSGKPELVPVIYSVRRAVTSGKQPRQVTP